MPLPDDLLAENVSDTDNANTIIRRAMNVAEESEKYAVKLGRAFLDDGVKCAEIAERLTRAAVYVATVERLTKIDDSGQSDDPDGSDGPDGPDGPDDPIDPDTPYDYDQDIKPNGKAVDGIGYSEP